MLNKFNKNNNMIENNNIIKILSSRDHVLLRPNLYLGSTSLEDFQGFIYDFNSKKFKYKLYRKVQAFDKLLNEILDNSIDEALRTNFVQANKIIVTIKDKIITIRDNGRGVPTHLTKDLNGKQISQLELAFLYANSGSNFNDDERQTVGQNGVGSFCVNVFSKEFTVKTQNKEAYGEIRCKDNINTKECKITPKNSSSTYTEVSFIPDYERLNIKEIDLDLIYSRLVQIAACYPKISIKFNEMQIPKINSKDYLEYFNDDSVPNGFVSIPENEKIILGVFPSNCEGFIASSYINGLNVSEGGSHIDFVLNELIKRLRSLKPFKSYNIANTDIKNKLKLVCVLRNFPNIKFNSQTKEKLTNSLAEVREYFSSIDWDKLALAISKNSNIVDPIIFAYKVKKEAEEKLALKNSVKLSSFKSDKYLPSIKDKMNLFICEGDSAKGSLVPGLGRDYNSFFATKGIPLNGFTASYAEIAKNKELTDIIKILNMDIMKPNELQELTHKRIIIASDADADGSHIKGLYLSFFHKYAPYLIKEKRLFFLKTPISAVLKPNGSFDTCFFSIREMEQYLNSNVLHGNQSIKYYKGLGSLTTKLYRELIDNVGEVDNLFEPFMPDAESPILINNWLNEGLQATNQRKVYLKNFQLNINCI